MAKDSIGKEFACEVIRQAFEDATTGASTIMSAAVQQSWRSMSPSNRKSVMSDLYITQVTNYYHSTGETIHTGNPETTGVMKNYCDVPEGGRITYAGPMTGADPSGEAKVLFSLGNRSTTVTMDFDNPTLKEEH